MYYDPPFQSINFEIRNISSKNDVWKKQQQTHNLKSTLEAEYPPSIKCFFLFKTTFMVLPNTQKQIEKKMNSFVDLKLLYYYTYN